MVIIIKKVKKMIKLFSLLSIFLLVPITAYADTVDIIIDESFTEKDGLWIPGRIDSKEFYIHNNKSNKISIDKIYLNLKECEYWKTGEKLDVNSSKFEEFAKYSKVTLKHKNNILFEGTFENLLSKDGINLSKKLDINKNSKELLDMRIDIDIDMNNDAQALRNTFDIGLTYSIDDSNSIISQTGDTNILYFLGLISIASMAICILAIKNTKGEKTND